MELAEIRPFEPQMAEIDLFTMPDAVGVGEPSVRKVKPYIAGHITDGSSTFTFKVNGNDVTVSVSGGDWKYKPTDAITSLAFVGVPQLESLELNKITGVSTFNLDYPVVPVFKKCDATTEAALNYVYHIRGTATSNFSFLLYFVDKNGTESTESKTTAIDGNGNWDVTYSGKKISKLYYTFNKKSALISVDFSCADDFSEVTEINSFLACTDGSTDLTRCIIGTKNFKKLETLTVFGEYSKIEELDFGDSTFGSSLTSIAYAFVRMTSLKTLKIPKARFESVTNANVMLRGTAVETLDLRSATFESLSSSTAMWDFTTLKNLYVPNSSTFPTTLDLGKLPLTYDSMQRVAGWLKDLTGSSAKTVTFKADTYNALTAEQQAALTAIIVTEKGWNLATA